MKRAATYLIFILLVLFLKQADAQTTEWIQGFDNHYTPVVNGIIHQKIEKDTESGFIKSFIPISDSAPHMANYADKHYFKRSGDSFYMCEHFDILDIFSRKVSPKLQLEYKVIPRQKTFQNCFKYCVLLSITNHSNVAARFPYLGLTTSNIFFPDEFGIDGNGHTGLIKVFNNTSYEHNYIGGSERIIYPKSKLDVNYFISKIPYDKPPPSLNISYIISAENASTLEGKIEIKSDEFE